MYSGKQGIIDDTNSIVNGVYIISEPSSIPSSKITSSSAVTNITTSYQEEVVVGTVNESSWDDTNENKDLDVTAIYTLNSYDIYSIDSTSETWAISNVDASVEFWYDNQSVISIGTVSTELATSNAIAHMITDSYNNLFTKTITNEQALNFNSLNSAIEMDEADVDSPKNFQVSENQVLGVDTYTEYNSSEPIIPTMDYVKSDSFLIVTTIFAATWLIFVITYLSKKELKSKASFAISISLGIVAVGLSVTIAAIVLGAISILSILPLAFKSFKK